MTKSQVVVGALYIAQVSGKRTVVRVIAARSLTGGWTGINCQTGYHILIRSAQRLRELVPEEDFQKALGQKANALRHTVY